MTHQSPLNQPNSQPPYLLHLVVVLASVVVILISTRGCGNSPKEKDLTFVYDSIERVVKSKLPPPDTIHLTETETVTRWLPGAVIRDTIEIAGEPYPVYSEQPIDTAAIITHYLTQATTYSDTIRDSEIEAVIQDTIFRNTIAGRGFSYKILRPIQAIDKTDRFQLIASVQFGAGATYTNLFNGFYAGGDIGLKFRSGTYFSLGYMAGSSHFATIRAGQVIRLRKRKP